MLKQDASSKRPGPLAITAILTSPTSEEHCRDDLFQSAISPQPPSTLPTGEIKRKRGRPHKDATSSTPTSSTSSSGKAKRGRGCSCKDNTFTSTTPTASSSSIEPSHTRGKARTHYRDITARMPRPVRPKAQPNQDGNRVQKRPQPNQYTKRRLAQDVAAAQETQQPPPPVLPETPSADLCEEEPHLFSGLEFVEAIITLNEAPAATHSPPVLACENATRHSKPYHVCSTCHRQASKNIRENYPYLLAQDKLFPLCGPCGFRAVHTAVVVLGQEGGQWSKLGCRCQTAWLCAECRLHELEMRQARAEAEREFRTGIVGVGSADGGKTRCAVLGIECRCGGMLTGREQVWVCVGCEGLMVKEV